MNLKEYVKEILQLEKDDRSIQIVDVEPAFKFSLEKRGESDDDE